MRHSARLLTIATLTATAISLTGSPTHATGDTPAAGYLLRAEMDRAADLGRNWTNPDTPIRFTAPAAPAAQTTAAAPATSTSPAQYVYTDPITPDPDGEIAYYLDEWGEPWGYYTPGVHSEIIDLETGEVIGSWDPAEVEWQLSILPPQIPDTRLDCGGLKYVDSLFDGKHYVDWVVEFVGVTEEEAIDVYCRQQAEYQPYVDRVREWFPYHLLNDIWGSQPFSVKAELRPHSTSLYGDEWHGGVSLHLTINHKHDLDTWGDEYGQKTWAVADVIPQVFAHQRCEVRPDGLDFWCPNDDRSGQYTLHPDTHRFWPEGGYTYGHISTFKFEGAWWWNRATDEFTLGQAWNTPQ